MGLIVRPVARAGAEELEDLEGILEGAAQATRRWAGGPKRARAKEVTECFADAKSGDDSELSKSASNTRIIPPKWLYNQLFTSA